MPYIEEINEKHIQQRTFFKISVKFLLIFSSFSSSINIDLYIFSKIEFLMISLLQLLILFFSSLLFLFISFLFLGSNWVNDTFSWEKIISLLFFEEFYFFSISNPLYSPS